MTVRPLAAPMAVAAAAAGGCVAIWLADPTTPGGVLPVCPTKALLGVACPGCGSLRMIYSLLHFDVAAAVRFNALGVVAVLLLVSAYVTWGYGLAVGRPIRTWHHLRWAAPAALVAIVVWFVVRNLPFEPFTALQV
ncbi:Protein of unknown function [Mycolicibacterium rutilum]|uniref:DUF2752 domain-containing protein n=1 Tax=Mycolicibacterium rutilum TaxID=370526 RepID=A0A1H6M0B8_MYCRU|nr:DUF2752 domain-containing protein [Mycolicibacterium rutilum]SEH92248.1 Protein of unknown function [Mycolicibacterium rutilum]